MKYPTYLITFIVVVSLMACSAPHRKEQQLTTLPQAIPDVEWDALFTRTEGWTGGDVAGSIDLGDGRTVWVFGDSWVGGVAEGKHAPGSWMVNNTIAIHDSSSLGHNRAPLYKNLKFFWGPDNQQKNPTAWVIPNEKADTEWFWTSGGGVVLPGPDEQNRLVIFLFHLTKKGEEDSSWNFKGIGCAMAIVDDIGQPVEKWKPRQVLIPYGENSTSETKNQDVTHINWGVSAWSSKPGNSPQRMNWLYIYGVEDSDLWNKKLMLARVLPEEIEEVAKWEYYSGEGGWSSDMHRAVPVTENISSELSVEEYRTDGKSTFIMVYSEPSFSPRILVKTAENPEGPWSEPKAVYTVPGLDRGKDYFTYAAKGHLHLSRPGELLITYVINANDFWDAASDATIYRPRFVRVPMELVKSDE